LEDIENNEKFIDEGKIEISSEIFIETWNKINNTKWDKDDFHIYNGQPGVEFNWIDSDSKIKSPIDPWNYGTSPGANALGNVGIYGADNIKQAILWATGFINIGIEKRLLTNENMVIFDIKLILNNNIKICYISKNLEWINYDTKLDEEYDIIVGEGFQEIKITTRKYDNFTKINKLLLLNKKYYYKDTFDANVDKIINEDYDNKGIVYIDTKKFVKYEPKNHEFTGLPQLFTYKNKYIKYKQKYLALKSLLK
jgi:hypothetical protein